MANEPSEQDWQDFSAWCERDKQDAARYRWLRDNKAYVAVQPHHQDLPKAQRTGWAIRLICGDDTSMDAAIDASMGLSLIGRGEEVAEPTPAEVLASRLINAWCDAHGRQISWEKAIEITAIVTKMPDAEKQRLLSLAD